MAKEGWKVSVLEKHDIPGGRARKYSAEGFIFDMGPSWYWMPDVFERFFNCFGYKVSDLYSLIRLDPSYRVYWENGSIDIPADYNHLKALFEKIEKGSGERLEEFLKEAEYKYGVGIKKLVYKPGRSVSEFFDPDFAKGIIKLDVFTSMKKHVNKYFSDARLVQLMEFPVLFLGAMPNDIPALYSMMNYADIKLGTWYPKGGMYSVVDAMYTVAKALGVEFTFNADVTSILIEDAKAKKVEAIQNGEKLSIDADIVIGAADYHFIENELLPAQYRSYNERYWERRLMAPSCLLYYIGINKKLSNNIHHSLFFDVNFEQHGKDIYDTPAWPKDPLFYVCSTSATDDTVAPGGCENLFFLIPVAAGLTGDDEKLRDAYFNKIIKRFELRTGEKIMDAIIYKKSYSITDFVNDYNAFKGNAYGLANTLLQTAIWKPGIKSKKVKNLFYTGQLTVPGPGVPPSLISGEVVVKEIIKEFDN